MVKKWISERLKRLEDAAKARTACLYPPDNDGFCAAFAGDRVSEYQHGSGYDVIKMLSESAAADWAGYEESDTETA